jgi:hypothetical protein
LSIDNLRWRRRLCLVLAKLKTDGETIMRPVLLIGGGVIAGAVAALSIVLVVQPHTAHAQAATTSLPAPSCSTSTAPSPSGWVQSSFACAADISGGGRQEIVLGTYVVNSPRGNGIIISSGGAVKTFTW